ncbi:hypothetical protein ACHAXR_007939, partial [Thalassiosira sp. AJA248-18]
DDAESALVEVVVEEIQEEIEDLAALFNAAQALPPYAICPPPLVRDRPDTQNDDAVFHMGEFRIVPEDDIDDEEGQSSWQYSLSDMDVNNDASIIAIGMGDYAADTGYAVGMVRTFAYSCNEKQWKRLGQDLLGNHQYEMFGHRVSSNGDGRVLAISAPQGSYDGGTGFVEVYSLDETTTGRWELLGERIDVLEKAESDYYLLGHAVDISDRGETLAVLGIIDDENENPSYVTRVFDYNYRKKEWMRKGHDLVIANVTYGRDFQYDYSPQVSLSDTGDKLVVTDPQMGVVKCTYLNLFVLLCVSAFIHANFTHDDVWNDDIDKEYWISSLDLDDRGELVAFSAFEEEDGSIVDSIKIVDFQQQRSSSNSGVTSVPLDVYARDFRGWTVDLSVAVSDMGNVAAFVASKVDVDDDNWWDMYDYSYGDDIVGALTVVTKYEGDEVWSVVGKGTEAESLGVSGSKVSLSGDGQIAAIGYDTVVSLYGISLDRPDDSAVTSSEVEINSTTINQENPDEQEGQDEAAPTTSAINICIPFPNATTNGYPLGHIDDLPQTKEGEEEKQHTLSLSLSEDASIVAVGIDSFDGEDRGLVRAFAWSCDVERYIRLGQDLLGSHEFDGFGQAVDLSADGKTLAVGANQPPPGKSGYVNVYELQGNEWKVTGNRIKDFPEGVSDVGRGVHLSDSGQTLMILGSICSDECDSSFIRVVQKENDEWVPVGEDIIASVNYDEYGTSAHATLSGDGKTVAVTGSYSQFFAKLYQFEASSWAETVIPPPSCIDDDSENMEDDGLDYFYECYFMGEDIAVNKATTFLAIAGTSYRAGSEIGMVRVLSKDLTTGNFSISEDPIDFRTIDPIDFTSDSFSSVDISNDGKHLVVGINGHSDDPQSQGQGVSFEFETQYASSANDSKNPGNWMGPVGQAGEDGNDQKDLLGARVRVTSNGRLAAASSRRGYISFFPAFSTTNMGAFTGSVDSFNGL